MSFLPDRSTASSASTRTRSSSDNAGSAGASDGPESVGCTGTSAVERFSHASRINSAISFPLAADSIFIIRCKSTPMLIDFFSCGFNGLRLSYKKPIDLLTYLGLRSFQ